MVDDALHMSLPSSFDVLISHIPRKSHMKRFDSTKPSYQLGMNRLHHCNIFIPSRVQYDIADCAGWVPRLNLLDLQTNFAYRCSPETELVHI